MGDGADRSGNAREGSLRDGRAQKARVFSVTVRERECVCVGGREGKEREKRENRCV